MILNKKIMLFSASMLAMQFVGTTTSFAETLTSAEHVQKAHLTTSHGWSNDLQTISWNSNGYYDVYFLHSEDGATNPFGAKGQDWTHTTTKDFVHYTSQNVAIPAQGGDSQQGWKSAWTGSVVTNNGQIKGVPRGKKVAYFTGLRKSDGKQNLYASWSDDNGRTYRHPLNNGRPILDVRNSINGNDFRDETVFYWNGKVMMYVAEGDAIGAYQSKDGINWTKADPRGASKIGTGTFFRGRNWNGNAPIECPVIRTMKMTNGQTKQVLFFGAKDASRGETTGTYYIVGHLDGNGMFAEETEVQRLDQGSDYYGANFSGSENLDVVNTSIKSMGWIGNWNYSTSGVHSDQNERSDYAKRLGSYSTARNLRLGNDKKIISTLDIPSSSLTNLQQWYNVARQNPVTRYHKEAAIRRDTNGNVYMMYDLPGKSATKYYDLTFKNTRGNYNGRIYFDIWQGKDYIRFNYDPTNGRYVVSSYASELNNSINKNERQRASSYYYDGLLGNGNGYAADSGVRNQRSINLKVVTDNNSVEIIFPNGQTYTVQRFATSGKQDFKILTEDPTNTNRVDIKEYDMK